MLQHLKTSIFMVVAMAILFGFVFPMVVTGFARTAFPRQASGSLIEKDGKVVGSDLIGQSFTAPGTSILVPRRRAMATIRPAPAGQTSGQRATS